MSKRTVELLLSAAPRLGGETREGRVFVPPGLRQAPVLDLMCSHFVLTLAARQGPRFNVRRDLNALLSLAGRHLVWPQTVLLRVREFLGRRCKATICANKNGADWNGLIIVFKADSKNRLLRLSSRCFRNAVPPSESLWSDHRRQRADDNRLFDNVC